MYFTITNLLDASEISQVGSILRRAKFIDGAATAKDAALCGTKKNQEMEVSADYATLAELLNRAVDRSADITTRLYPRYRTNPIISRYDVGMFYAEHTDSPIQGGVTQVGRGAGRFGQNLLRTDYSITLFLSDPDTYDGGELQLQLFEDTKLVKLGAGSAVCYATGIPHSVTPVTRGTRTAAVYWIQSLIRNPQIRIELRNQYRLEQELHRVGQGELADKAESIRSNIVRYLADV